MTDAEEFAARSQLKWQRDGDVWILLYRRKRMGRVVPDKDHPGMWRSVKSNGRSDLANLSWAKDAFSHLRLYIPPQNPNKTGGVANRNRHPFV